MFPSLETTANNENQTQPLEPRADHAAESWSIVIRLSSEKGKTQGIEGST